jgi:hypothetical protein
VRDVKSEGCPPARGVPVRNSTVVKSVVVAGSVICTDAVALELQDIADHLTQNVSKASAKCFAES